MSEVKKEKAVREKKTKPKAHRVKVKADPAIVAKARELRDRWLEQVNASDGIASVGVHSAGKIGAGRYELGRTCQASGLIEATPGKPLAIDHTSLAA